MESRNGLMAFDMGELRNNLPKKRGLSRYYSGKARSFACISDVKCLEDLKKQTQPFPLDGHKKRKKQLAAIDTLSNNTNANANSMNFPTYHCRRVSSSSHCASPCIGA